MKCHSSDVSLHIFWNPVICGTMFNTSANGLLFFLSSLPTLRSSSLLILKLLDILSDNGKGLFFTGTYTCRTTDILNYNWCCTVHWTFASLSWFLTTPADSFLIQLPDNENICFLKWDSFENTSTISISISISFMYFLYLSWIDLIITPHFHFVNPYF